MSISERSKNEIVMRIVSVILAIVAAALTVFAWNPDRNMLWFLLAFIIWVAAFVEFAINITKSSISCLIILILIWIGADFAAIAFIVRLAKTIVNLF